jgi:fibronectin type 3 domain-containing protein
MQRTSVHRMSLACLIPAITFAMAAAPRGALAATYTVSTLADSGAGSLRAAIESANGDPGPSTIDFQSGLSGTITLASGLPAITRAMTIQGPGASGIAIDAASSCRPFEINAPSATITLSGLTIQHGKDLPDNAGGGGIRVTAGALSLADCNLTENAATGNGGAIYNNGDATMTGCVFFGNSAHFGGAVFNDDNGASRTLVLLKCTMYYSAAYEGGGIYNSSSHGPVSVVNLTNCTVYGGNVAQYGGFGVNQGSLSAMNCTLVGNTAGLNGGGLRTDAGGASTLTNCILYYNTSAASDLIGSGVINITYSDIESGHAGTGNISIDPKLVGMPGDFHLRSDSPCLGAGTAAGSPATAQDGAARPNPPSIGAYEVKLISPAPAGLTATPGVAKVTLSWTASVGVTSYNVKRAAVSGGPYATVASPVTNSYVDTGLTNGTTYYYVVSAVNAAGESPDSAQVSVTLPPPAPTGLTATPSDQQVTLTWSAAPTATAYRVRRAAASGGPYTTIASVTSTLWANTGLTNGTAYYYIVAGTSASGDGPNSAEASATPAITIPAVPSGLTAKLGDSSVTLSWNASSGAAFYRVRRAAASGGPYTTIATVTNNLWANTGLTNGTTYFYVVAAGNSAGTSANSPEAAAIPIAAPTGLTATPGNTQVALSWNAVSGTSGYRVRRGTVSGGPYTTVAAIASTSWTSTGLTNGVAYFYVVAAFNSSGDGPNSAQASATPN